MICERCKNKNAEYHFKSNVNGQLSGFHLCSECATQLGLTASVAESLGDMFSAFSPCTVQEGTLRRRVCPGCGSHESEIASCGYAGCAECYKTFSALLSPYIAKLHGKANHTGKVPLGYSRAASEQIKKEKELLTLKNQLEAAIREEKYELAAKLRDSISALKSSVE